jgi:hypothetical protein
MENEPASRNDA